MEYWLKYQTSPLLQYRQSQKACIFRRYWHCIGPCQTSHIGNKHMTAKLRNSRI